MKIALIVIFIALFFSPTLAQQVSIEEEFERERRSLALDRYTMGEDASSGFYYLIYKSSSHVRKIRAIWNGGCCQAPEVVDYYFKDGSPVLYVKLASKRGQLKALIRGGKPLLKPVEKIHMKDSKITTWIENGKTIPSSDPRWKEQEVYVLKQFRDELEGYQQYQEGR
jgi:hypothetical protein